MGFDHPATGQVAPSKERMDPMQIGQSAASFQLRFDQPGTRSTALTAEQQAKRTLTALSSAKLFEDNQRVLSQGVRTETFQRSRTPLYQQVERELANLQARLGSFALGNEGAFQAAGPTSVTSPAPLNLGEGRRVQSTTTSTYQPPAVESTLDPNATLASQPFTNPITSGTLTVTFRVNGGAATNKNVAINPNTDSLNSVLAKLNNLTVSGVKPLTATFDATTGEIDFRVNSTKGTNFDFTFGADSSGFLTAISADGTAASRQVTASNAIVNSATRTKYFKLNLTIEGVGTRSFNNLQVSSAGLSIGQKVDELVTQINAGLGGTGLTAVNAGGGKLGFTSDDPNAPLRPNLGLTITESSKASSVGLGFQTAGGGRFKTVADVVTDPDLVDVLPPPVTTTTTIDTTVGGALGTDATLRDLAGQLGLQAVNGQYAFDVNGQTLSFTEDQTLDQVLEGFKAAGVTATYDADTQRITVDAGDQALAIQDVAGNLTERLGIEVLAADANNLALTREAGDFVQALDDVVSLLESGTAKGTGLEEDRLLQDLRAALNGLFTSSGTGALGGLADLGFARENGELRIDTARLGQLATERTDELNQFIGSFFGERVTPLVRAGERALQDAGEVAAAESQAASQAVKVRGEIARLQSRQQMLALERLNFENLRDRLEKQDEELKRSAEDLEKRTASGRPEEIDEAAWRARQLAPDQDATTFPPVLAPGAAGPPPPAGLSSFGLAQGTNA